MHTQSHFYHRALRRQASRLAASLQLLMQIPSGVALVAILGQGDEYSNVDALTSWVARQLPHLDELTQDDPLDILVGRLEYVLSTQE